MIIYLANGVCRIPLNLVYVGLGQEKIEFWATPELEILLDAIMLVLVDGGKNKLCLLLISWLEHVCIQILFCKF